MEAVLERGDLTRIAETAVQVGAVRQMSTSHVLRVLRGERKPSAELAQVIVAHLGHRTPHAARPNIAAALGRTEADLWPVVAEAEGV